MSLATVGRQVMCSSRIRPTARGVRSADLLSVMAVLTHRHSTSSPGRPGRVMRSAQLERALVQSAHSIRGVAAVGGED